MRKLICGKNNVMDAIKNGLPIKFVYTKYDLPQGDYALIKMEMNELSKMTNENHQGYIAILHEFKYHSIDTLFIDKPNTILILDHIHDPQNFGSIIRTANAFGVKHIIIAKDRQVQVTETVLKVSSGGFVNMKIILVTNISRTIDDLKKKEYWIFGSAITNDALKIGDVDFNYRKAIILGNEEKGISSNVLKKCDFIFKIPTYGTVQSLNVAIATSIILFHISNLV